MPLPIKTVSVHLDPAENPHDYQNPINAYEKGSFYCVLRADGKVDMYPLDTVWRVRIEYHGPA